MCSLVMKWLSLFAMRTAGLMMTVALSFVVPSAVGQVVDDHIPNEVSSGHGLNSVRRWTPAEIGPHERYPEAGARQIGGQPFRLEILFRVVPAVTLK
mmetsp:Transcript_55060/g.129233  ORF Transcript_55060/g.129233 Transcript_55060/m.129233 type:complete len:97 (-) Transcript_55060:443-733(-)